MRRYERDTQTEDTGLIGHTPALLLIEVTHKKSGRAAKMIDAATNPHVFRPS